MAAAIAKYPFDSGHESLHAAPLLLRAGRGVDAAASIESITSWRRPAPLAWMIEACAASPASECDRDGVLAYIGALAKREADVLRHVEPDDEDNETELDDFLTWAIDAASELGPAPLLEKIRGWFDEGLIDPTVTGHKWFEKKAAMPAMECIAEAATKEDNRYIHDALDEMATQADIEGDRTSGWARLLDCADGLTHQSISINHGKSADRIEVFYKTQNFADQGRPWFEALAGASVEFAGRVLSDPKGIMQNMAAGKATPAARFRMRFSGKRSDWIARRCDPCSVLPQAG
ncbi:MAG: hypothetical protein Q8O52_17240 [Sulfuritalea sp.]|nr:hypothetical protein [Sulfuritalea sp.]